MRVCVCVCVCVTNDVGKSDFEAGTPGNRDLETGNYDRVLYPRYLKTEKWADIFIGRSRYRETI